MVRQDEIERIPIEGKFGQGKRRFSLARIMCKLSETSETAIAVVFLVMNLEKLLKVVLLNFFACFGSLLESFYALKVSCGNACEVVKLHMSGFYKIFRCQKKHFGT